MMYKYLIDTQIKGISLHHFSFIFFPILFLFILILLNFSFIFFHIFFFILILHHTNLIIKKYICLVKIIVRWVFECKINEKQIFMKEKHVSLASIKSRFETQLYMWSNPKGKNYLINQTVFYIYLDRIQKLP